MNLTPNSFLVFIYFQKKTKVNATNQKMKIFVAILTSMNCFFNNLLLLSEKFFSFFF